MAIGAKNAHRTWINAYRARNSGVSADTVRWVCRPGLRASIFTEMGVGRMIGKTKAHPSPLQKYRVGYAQRLESTAAVLIRTRCGGVANS